MPENPKLRPELVIAPVEIQGEQLIFFQDPEHWCEEMVFVPVQFAPIIQYFTGEMSIRDIQAGLMRESGELLESGIIEKIAQEFDERRLLDSENFRAYVRKVTEEWERSELRPALLAGQSYPKEAGELKSFLDQFYTGKDAPGLPAENRSNELKGIIAPHIELGPNGQAYAHAYKRLVEQSQAEVFLVLGTAHSLTGEFMLFTEKNFETPLGVCRTDREFIRGVKKRLRKISHAPDFPHRREHSIELQILLLQHALAGKKEFGIVPVMVGSFQTMIELGSSPAEDMTVIDYVRAFREEIQASGKKVCVIASADLAHLGPRYGDEDTYAPIREDEIREDDEKMLGPLKSGDGEGFFQQVSAIEDRRKICGLSPIYMAYSILKPGRAELLQWSVAYDQQTRSAVSFCAMALY